MNCRWWKPFRTGAPLAVMLGAAAVGCRHESASQGERTPPNPNAPASDGGLKVPCLPLISTRRVEEIREAIVDAFVQPELAVHLNELLIFDFVPLDASDYEHLLGYSGDANFRYDRPGNS